MVTPSVAEMTRGTCHASGELIAFSDHLIARRPAPPSNVVYPAASNVVYLSDRRDRELAANRLAGGPATAALAEPA
jgi:hypothetical protein